MLITTFPYILSNTESLLAIAVIFILILVLHRQHQNISCLILATREKDEQLITELCGKGLEYRYTEDIKRYKDQGSKKNWTMIKQMDFVPFFLVNWDIINYAQSKGLLPCWAEEVGQTVSLPTC